MKKPDATKNSFLLFVSAGLAVMIIFFPPAKTTAPQGDVLGVTYQQLPIAQDITPRRQAGTPDFETPAHAVYAIDLRSKKILFEKAARTPWKPASLTKLMTALVAVNSASLDQIIQIEPEDTRVPAPRMGLVAGEKISVENLLKGMLVASANDAALALARGIGGTQAEFVRLMNAMVKQLDLKSTNFKNPHGFDEVGQYSTAEDLAKLTLEFLRHSELASMVQIQKDVVRSEDGKIRHWLTTTNILLNREDVLGVKTGYTEEARGNLIILFSDKNQNQILTVVLGSEHRESESERFIDWIRKSYEF